MSKIRREDALNYHEFPTPGKIEVLSTKPTQSQRDLSLAYSPGVADPCLEIAKKPQDVYKYTVKGNLVAVISNGTAVLGLGNIGAEASKPVMEGKAVLFKIFADINVFDIEINETDPKKFIEIVKALEPTFGGINLEDIKAPDCFEIEEGLKKTMNIPVMHDDQHGTAIISGAGLLNALEIAGKKIEDVQVLVSGSGAAALSCVKIYIQLGVKKENVIICDSKGVVHKNRKDLNASKQEFATDKNIFTLTDALDACDVFLGLSVGNILKPEMIKKMNPNPIIFALANPTPEIDYNLAIETRPDVIMATGRSDFPNQINNVLGFPFIFRGALDVRATAINEAMKLAAVRAIANLAKEPVPEIVKQAYKAKSLTFNKNYIIPKPLDTRLLTTVSPAVAQAAIESGVAQLKIENWQHYKDNLTKRMGRDDYLIKLLTNQACRNPQRIIFPEAEEPNILKAVDIISNSGIAKPILLGSKEKINALAQEYAINIKGCPIINPRDEEENKIRLKTYKEIFLSKGQRKGYNYYELSNALKGRVHFAMMMLLNKDADAVVTGYNRQYVDVLKQTLLIVGAKDPKKKVAGMYVLLTKKGPIFLADTTNIPEPTAQDLANTAKLAAECMENIFYIKPNIAFLYHSNYGASSLPRAKNIRKAVQILKEELPQYTIDGEIQANLLFDKDKLKENYPFSSFLKNEANLLIFPNLTSGNIAYKLLQTLGNIEAIGPISLGLAKPVHIMQIGSSVREIVNIATYASVEAQLNKEV